MKKIYIILIILNIALCAEEFNWNSLVNDVDKLWTKTKKYSNQGKNIVIEQTLINGINALTDNNKIKVNSFDINNTTNYINMVVYLNGEDKNLTIKIKDFTWGVKDDNYIVFDTLDILFDIEWIDYLVSDMIKREGGRLIIPNSPSTFSLLFAIKPNIKIKKDLPAKAKFDFVHYNYDKSLFKINHFKVDNKNIIIDIFTKGSRNNIMCEIKNYKLRTANRKQIIALQNIKFGTCNKPWITSIIENQNNEVHFEFNKKLYALFGGKVN